MKEFLLLCTKKVHFIFNGKIYMQVDGVAMGSPLGPVLAGLYIYDRVGKGNITRVNRMY